MVPLTLSITLSKIFGLDISHLMDYLSDPELMFKNNLISSQLNWISGTSVVFKKSFPESAYKVPHGYCVSSSF